MTKEILKIDQISVIKLICLASDIFRGKFKLAEYIKVVQMLSRFKAQNKQELSLETFSLSNLLTSNKDNKYLKGSQ